MSIIPLHVQRRFEQRWASRFIFPVASNVFQRMPERKPRHQRVAARGKDQRKTRRVETAGFVADLITRRRHLHYKNTESRARHAGMQAADHGRSIEFAQLGVMQALARNEERVFDSSRKTATCGPIK
jgi:hypothetical protein